jgi:O-antigen/teichoic acid export membrane protein
MSDLRQKMARGASWMVAFKLIDRGIGLVSTLVLARVLLPQDFGLVSMATSLVALLELFSAFSLDVVLIQRQNSSPELYDTAWTLNGLMGLIVAAFMLALAWPMSLFYHEPRLFPVACVLALGSAVQGFENIGVVAFRQQMEFHKEFRFLLSKRLLTFAIAVPLALWLRNYWALVAGILTGRIAGVAISYAIQSYRPSFSLKGSRELVGFSRWLLLQNFLGFLRDRSADFVVGRFGGSHALGVFRVSSEIASLPATELIAPINRAILPAYAQIAGDLSALRREYISVMSVIALIGIPPVAGLAATSPLVVALLLGNHWLDATPILGIIAVAGVTEVLQSNAYGAFVALGQPQVFLKITVIHVVILLVALFAFTLQFGALGAAWAYLVTGLILIPVTFWYVLPALKMRAAELFLATWRPVLASTAMYFVVRATLDEDLTILTTARTALLLARSVAIGIATYCVAIAVSWALAGRPVGAETMVFGQLQQRFRWLPGQS